MRLAPNTDTVPAAVDRYLLPQERQDRRVISVRKHLAALIGPIFVVLVGLAIAIWLSNSVAHRSGTDILLIWVLWGILLLGLGEQVWAWAVSYFAATSQRLLFVQGVIIRKVKTIPLTEMTDITLKQSAIGRMLGYGEFIVKSAGQDRALRKVRFIPYPEQLYLEVCGLIFKGEEPAADASEVATELSQVLTRWLNQQNRPDPSVDAAELTAELAAELAKYVVGPRSETSYEAVSSTPSPATEAAPASEADQPPPANALAYPRLDAPGEVAPGVIFAVTVGLRADADRALMSTGPMDLPADIELQVAVQFDPIAFVLVNSSSTETLRRTTADLWPSAEFRFVALAGQELLAARGIGVKFLRNGQVVGFASRALVVRSAGDAAAGSTQSSPSAVVTAARTRDPEAERLDLREFADDEVDLLLFIQRSADVAGARLVFTAHSRHADIEDQAKPVTEELRGESKSGTTPQQIGQESRLKVATTGDGEDLFAWLTGLGVRIFRSLPAEISAAVRAAVAKGTVAAPARILLFSEEPYVPWELAVDPDGWPSAMGTTAPFLGAHAAISRWFLGEVPPPKPRPVPSMDVRGKALVTAHYDGIAGVMKWGPLPEAEAEVENLAAFLAPGVAIVPPGLHDVLKLLDGTPPADLMHFALHGNFDPLSIQGGLILLRTDDGKPTAQNLQENHVIGKKLGQEPFVYLNACQVATGNSATFGGYGGLAAAFLTAGAKGVLAPLWNIQDGTASELASEFYHLSAGDERLPAAEILRRFRARYTPEAVGGGAPNVNATLIAFQLFGHPGLRLFPEAARAPELSHG